MSGIAEASASAFALVGLLATMGLLAAACGGAANTAGAASAASTSTTTSSSTTTSTSTTVAPSGSSGSSSLGQSRQAELLQLSPSAALARVPNFPDLSARRGNASMVLAHSGVHPESPAF